MLVCHFGKEPRLAIQTAIRKHSRQGGNHLFNQMFSSRPAHTGTPADWTGRNLQHVVATMGDSGRAFYTANHDFVTWVTPLREPRGEVRVFLVAAQLAASPIPHFQVQTDRN